jgi:hypothetical protein
MRGERAPAGESLAVVGDGDRQPWPSLARLSLLGLGASQVGPISRISVSAVARERSDDGDNFQMLNRIEAKLGPVQEALRRARTARPPLPVSGRHARGVDGSRAARSHSMECESNCRSASRGVSC